MAALLQGFSWCQTSYRKLLETTLKKIHDAIWIKNALVDYQFSITKFIFSEQMHVNQLFPAQHTDIIRNMLQKSNKAVLSNNRYTWAWWHLKSTKIWLFNSLFLQRTNNISNLHITVLCQGKILIKLNSSPPSAAYMRQWIGSALVQIMACRLFGAKPLSKPMLGYYQLDPWEQISMKF